MWAMLLGGCNRVFIIRQKLVGNKWRVIHHLISGLKTLIKRESIYIRRGLGGLKFNDARNLMRRRFIDALKRLIWCLANDCRLRNYFNVCENTLSLQIKT